MDAKGGWDAATLRRTAAGRRRCCDRAADKWVLGTLPHMSATCTFWKSPFNHFLCYTSVRP